MSKGSLIKGIGLVSGIFGILGFFGVQSYKNLEKPPQPSRSATSAAAPGSTAAPVDPDAGKWHYIHAADKACYAATGKVDTAGKYSTRSPAAWPAAIGALRADMVVRWKNTGKPDDPFGTSFGDETEKVWADYADATWWWSEMTGELKRGKWDDARASYEKFKMYDDSAIRRATALGYVTCNFSWPRFTSW